MFVRLVLKLISDRSASQSPLKFHLGFNKIFHLFNWQLKGQCNLLNSIVGNIDGATLVVDMNANHFEVFVNWLYDKRLPSDLFPSTQVQANDSEESIPDSKASYKLMNGLYSFAENIAAKHFKNALMDAFCKHMNESPFKHFRMSYFAPALRHTMLHEYYLQIVVYSLGNCDEEHNDNDYTSIFEGDGQLYEAAMGTIYREIILRRVRYVTMPRPEMVWDGYAFHEHLTVEEICYSKECCKIRKEQGLKLQPSTPRFVAQPPVILRVPLVKQEEGDD